LLLGSEGLSQEQTAGALILIVFVVTILFVLVGVRDVYAQTVTVTPSTVTQGASFQVSGTGFDPSSAGLAEVWADISGSCVGNPLLFQNVHSDNSGNVAAVTFSSSSLRVGTHCVGLVTFDYDTASTSLVTITSAATMTSTTAPIPEYPFGLPILALFMVLGYPAIKRRTRKATRSTEM